MGEAAGGRAAEFRGRQVELGPGEVIQPLGREEGGGTRAGRSRVVLVIVLQQLRVRSQSQRGTLNCTLRSQRSKTYPAQHQGCAVDHAALWLHPQASSGVALLKLGPVDLRETPEPFFS